VVIGQCPRNHYESNDYVIIFQSDVIMKLDEITQFTCGIIRYHNEIISRRNRFKFSHNHWKSDVITKIYDEIMWNGIMKSVYIINLRLQNINYIPPRFLGVIYVRSCFVLYVRF